MSQLKDLSIKDSLTDLYNYRYFTDRIQMEFNRAKRYTAPFSILIADLDYFKSINDVYGHTYGDQILKEFAVLLQSAARDTDVVVRYGGDEFIIILPDTGQDGAARFGANLRKKLVDYVFDHRGKKLKLKASIGIATYPDLGITNIEELTYAVDRALLEAKNTGGDKMILINNAPPITNAHLIAMTPEQTSEDLKNKLNQMSDRVNQTLLESILAFVKTIEAKDAYTGSHSEHMVSLALDIGRKLGVTGQALEDLGRAAILHDLGKVGISDNILRKKGKLNKREMDKIRKHPGIGAEIIRNVHFLSAVVPIILYHHERFDGMGYSTGLRGEEIPIGARIISVVDVYQALVSHRPYRRAYSKKEALAIIKSGAGSHFDPTVVDAFISLIGSHKGKYPYIKTTPID